LQPRFTNQNVTGPVNHIDPLLTDFGQLFVAVDGVQGAGVALGELWVSYDVELVSQKEDDSQSIKDYLFDGLSSGVTNTAFFGNPAAAIVSSSLDVAVFNHAEYAGKVHLPATANGRVFRVIIEQFGPQVSCGGSSLVVPSVACNNCRVLTRDYPLTYYPYAWANGDLPNAGTANVDFLLYCDSSANPDPTATFPWFTVTMPVTNDPVYKWYPTRTRMTICEVNAQRLANSGTLSL